MLSSLISRDLATSAAAAMQAAKPPGLAGVERRPVGLKTLSADGGLDSPFRPNCVKRNFAAFTSSQSSLVPPLSSDEPETEVQGEERVKEEVDGVEDEGENYVGDEGDEESACWATYGKGRPSCRLPPPIPLLARTGNLTGHMPWVLKRIYKEDGSLVLREERVKHHEYFRAHRENGRLTLQLVEVDDRSPLLVSGPKRYDDDDDDDDDEEEEEEEEEKEGDDDEEESHYHTDQEDIHVDDDALMPSQDSSLLDYGGRSFPATGMSIMHKSSPARSTAVLSTSMPEPLCGHKWLDRGRPIGQLHYGAMPMVRGY